MGCVATQNRPSTVIFPGFVLAEEFYCPDFDLGGLPSATATRALSAPQVGTGNGTLCAAVTATKPQSAPIRLVSGLFNYRPQTVAVTGLVKESWIHHSII